MIKLISEVKKEGYAVKFTAEQDGQKVGWAYVYLIFNERHSSPYGLMENVYVEQEFRGKGIGTSLVKAVIQEAKDRGCYKIICASNLDAERVHALYASQGFKKQGYEFRLDFKESKPKQRD